MRKRAHFAVAIAAVIAGVAPFLVGAAPKWQRLEWLQRQQLGGVRNPWLVAVVVVRVRERAAVVVAVVITVQRARTPIRPNVQVVRWAGRQCGRQAVRWAVGRPCGPQHRRQHGTQQGTQHGTQDGT